MINVTQADLPELDEYIKYLKVIWGTKWLTNNGELLKLLSNNLKEFLNIKNLLMVANGTLALQIALKSLETEKRDIITTPFTFSATTNVILWEGFNAIFADINPSTFNIDPYDVEQKITNKTAAILAVHVYGNPCNVEKLQEIADSYDIPLIYDAAHAFGVEYKNSPILEYGDLSTLSFHATKVFNTIEGGAIVAKDETIIEKLALMRNHGIKSEEEVSLPGINAKMNEFQAAMGLCNLKHFQKKIEFRKKLYERYKSNLNELETIKFQKITASKYNFAYMPICFSDGTTKNKVFLGLLKKGFNPRKYFYPLTSNFEYFKNTGIDMEKKFGLKISSEIAERVLCLPLYPELREEYVDDISNTIIDVLKKI